jgi:Ohr subfamily peroxiredoxin
MKIFYTAVATATGGGRDHGHVRSSDGIIDAAIEAPVELGGKGGATNPEQLFAAGYSSCFLNAVRRVARRAQADVDGTTVTAEVGIGPLGEGSFGLAVTLKVSMPNVDRPRAQELVAAAHRVCPYSNATRGNVEVALEVV